jgi:hypothetical protein
MSTIYFGSKDISKFLLFHFFFIFFLLSDNSENYFFKKNVTLLIFIFNHKEDQKKSHLKSYDKGQGHMIFFWRRFKMTGHHGSRCHKLLI